MRFILALIARYIVAAGCLLILVSPVALATSSTPFQRSSSLVHNVFADAVGLPLTDASVDRYISSSVVGSDRTLARKLMLMMPQNVRSDFVYLSRDGHLLSNNPAMLPYVHVTYGRPSMFVTHSAPYKTSTGKNIQDGDSGRCSPPNPPPPSSPQNPTGGPYVRDVSDCGFTAGWGFVNVDCGYDLTTSSDAGTLYFELRGNGGQLTEGGVQYSSDTSVGPYLRVNGPYVRMNNDTVRYHCNDNIVIVHGSTSDGTMTFTETGELPGNIDPQTAWVTHQTITLNNASFMFYGSAGGVNGAGVDAAGFSTPCTGCSISKMTTIAQNNVPYGQGYNQDGSAFGVDPVGQINHIHWMQIAFGQWESDCVPNTTLCTFDAGPNPASYFSVTEPYPDGLVSQQSYNDLGYGPYETYDGILLPGGQYASKVRKAASTFKSPLPPIPCSPDAAGQCVFTTLSQPTLGQCNTGFIGPHGQPIYAYGSRYRYNVYRNGAPVSYLESTTKTVTVPPQAPCTGRTSWIPGEPRLQYNDPNLP